MAAPARGQRVGVDIELSDVPDDLLSTDVFTSAELAEIEVSPSHARRLWSRKEAVLKALGIGMVEHLRRIEVSGIEPPSVWSSVDVARRGHAGSRVWWRDVTAFSAHDLPVAVSASRPASISVHEWRIVDVIESLKRMQRS